MADGAVGRPRLYADQNERKRASRERQRIERERLEAEYRECIERERLEAERERRARQTVSDIMFAIYVQVKGDRPEGGWQELQSWCESTVAPVLQGLAMGGTEL